MDRTFLSAVALTVGLSACGADPPNVVLITIDTTRADHVGCFGYSEPTTPNIDRLAEEGVLFTKAFTTNPVTLPAHTSILTGTYPLFHGVRDNSTYVVNDEVTTLAEILKERGYRTAAFVGAFVLDGIFNLDQGFDTYDDDVGRDWAKDEIERRAANAFGFDERKANLVTHSAQAWLKTRPSGPFFLWAHYFDPHQPLNPPDPHRSRFTDPYDAEIAFVDEQLGELLRSLRVDGSYDNTVIVVVADHGEGLMDHGEPTHSLFIFDSTMHVPLVIKPVAPSALSVVDGLVSTVDIVPTILEMVGAEVPDSVQGRSLMPAMAGDPIPEDRSVYMESLTARLACGWGELRGLRNLSEKLIYGPKPRLYNVDEDPGEVFDLAQSDADGVQRVTGELEEAIALWRSPDSSRAVAGADPETLERLRALGYVTGAAAQAASVTEDLEDVIGMVDPHEKR
ncbi:MAG: sulfatase, partial [Acidobacteria bacterium]|nr:sulfatase [Acidobacteriota bacterium]